MLYDQSYTLAAANTAGYATNVTGAAFVLTANTAGDLLQHPVTILNNTTNSYTGQTLTLVGTDANGLPQTEVLTGPGISATVTSVNEYKTLTSVTPSVTIGADTFNIGWTAVASGPWVRRDEPLLSTTVGVSLGGTTINYDVEIALENPVNLTGRSNRYKSNNLTAKTVNAYDMMLGPLSAVRLHINSHTNGVVDFEVMQGL